MREIRPSGLEGGVRSIPHPYPYPAPGLLDSHQSNPVKVSQAKSR